MDVDLEHLHGILSYVERPNLSIMKTTKSIYNAFRNHYVVKSIQMIFKELIIIAMLILGKVHMEN